MNRLLTLGIGLFMTASFSTYSFANAVIAKNEHDAHHYNETKELVLSGSLDESGVRVIEVKASRYKFEPDPIVVKFGERVRLLVTSTDVEHGLLIDEYDINVAVPVGETKVAEFNADKRGEFHVHCSVYCGPGHAHMHATFIVR